MNVCCCCCCCPRHCCKIIPALKNSTLCYEFTEACHAMKVERCLHVICYKTVCNALAAPFFHLSAHHNSRINLLLLQNEKSLIKTSMTAATKCSAANTD